LERIQNGSVKVNDLNPSEGQPLRAGDEVTYTTEAWEEPEVNTNYRIIYEDETLVAVSKPAPLPVHAIGAYFENTLMSLLRKDRPESKDWDLVHRLDSETSGILLLAKDKKSLVKLQKAWSSKEDVRKIYQAIVFGKFSPESLALDAPIAPLKGSRIRMKLTVVDKSPHFEKGGTGGILDPAEEKPKPSVTEFKLID